MKSVTLTYRIIIFLSFIALSGMAQNGQNLVKNGGFEELRDSTSTYPCPTGGGQVFKAKYWDNAEGNCDYFNACSNEVWPNFGMPQNRMGNQGALNGAAYANVGCYSPQLADAREYLWQELPQALRGGQRYTLKFSVNLPDSLNFAINSVGGLLTKDDTRYWEKADFFDAVPQVESNLDSLLSDKEDWMPVSGSFVAEGGERYLTIGSFKRDVDLWFDRVSDNLNWDEAGYYIDVVELYEDNSIGIEESPLVSSNVYPNPVSDGWVTLEYSLASGRELRLLMTDMLGRTVRDMTLHALHAQQDIDVSMLGKGMFVMNLIVDGRVVLKEQVVVQ
jgi:hypothetical protein